MTHEQKFNDLVDRRMMELKAKILERNTDDFTELGQFFHFHLIVEDALVNFIKSENPNIGEIEKGAQQFMQKLKIAQNMKNSEKISHFNKGLQALNEIRNMMGHYPRILNYPEKQMKILREALEQFPLEPKDSKDIQIIKIFAVYFYGYVSVVTSETDTYMCSI